MQRFSGTRLACLFLLATSCQGSTRGELDGIERRSGAVTTPAPAVTLAATIVTPHLIPPFAVALASTQAMLIGASSKVTRPGTAVSVITNMGPGGVIAEPDGILGDIWSSSTVTLKDRVHAVGKVVAPRMVQGNSVRVDGGVDSTTPLVLATVTSWPVAYPSAVVTNIVVQNTQTATPTPGRYGVFQVFSGGKLTLRTGTYYIDTLDLESGSALILNQDAGPVLLYVITSIILMRGALSTTSGVPSDLLLAYFGAADMIVEMPFVGTIVAATKLILRSVSGGHSGAFFANTLEVGPNTTVTFRPGHAILSAQPPGTFDSCAASVRPSDSLTGNAREVQFQRDLLRFCTGVGIGACEQTIRARMNVDFFVAAASMLTGRMSTGTYQLVLTDRDARLKTFRKNATLACDVVAHDGDGDYIPDSADACKTSPALTPILANGCTNTIVPAGADRAAVQKTVKYLGVSVDPRCVGAPRPAVPAPLGAFRSNDQALGKAIWLSRDPGVTTCPLYYQIEVQLTDGSKPRSLTFQASENTTLSWIGRPAGAVQFNIHSTDPGNRGAWGSYAVFTRTFRVRAFNFAGQGSEWSDFFVFGHQDCVAGQPCLDL